MANPELKTTVLSTAMKTLYERRLLSRAIPRLVHGRHAEEPMIARGYNAYEFRRYPSLPLVSTTLSEGVTPTESTYSAPTIITVTPNFYGAWIGFSDIVELESYDPILSILAGVFGEQVGVSFDTIIRDTLHAGASVMRANNKASDAALDSPSDNLSYKDLVRLMAEMEQRGAMPVEGDKYMLILHPYAYMSLLTDSTFVAMFQHEETSGDSAIRTGYVGTLLRMNVYVSGNAKVYADAGTGGDDVYAALLIGREAYGILGLSGIPKPSFPDTQSPEGSPLTGKTLKPVDLIVKPVGSSGAADPLNQRGSIGWKAAMTVTVLNNNWVVSYRHTTDVV